MTVKITDTRWSAYSILRQRVLTECFPHAEKPAHKHSWNWFPPAQASAQDHIVTDLSVLSPGDVVAIVDADRYRGDYTSKVKNHTTLRDAADRLHNLYVVTSVTKARVKVDALSTPANWKDDPLSIEAQGYEQSFGISWQRDIVRMGVTLDEYRAAVVSHPDWERFVCFTSLAKEMQAEWDRQRKAEEAAAKARIAPKKALVKSINKAVGIDVARVGFYSDNVEWVDWSSKDMRALVLAALRGRLLAGEITQEEHDAAAAAATHPVKR